MKYKCARCSVFYTTDADGRTDNTPGCVYHRGSFQDFVVPFGSVRYGKWSCCKDVFPTSPGCVKGNHMEDVHTSTLLSSFTPTNTDDQSAELSTSISPVPSEQATLTPSTGDPTSISPVPPEQATLTPSTGDPALVSSTGDPASSIAFTPSTGDPVLTSESKVLLEDFIIYEVQFGETLAGIAIRFHCNAGNLKQINRLVNNEELYSRKTILIPKNPAKPPLPPPSPSLQARTSPVDQFIAKTGASREEALFYLEDNGWVVDHAVAAMVQDSEWDMKEGGILADKRVHQIKKVGELEIEPRRKAGCFAWLEDRVSSPS